MAAWVLSGRKHVLLVCGSLVAKTLECAPTHWQRPSQKIKWGFLNSDSCSCTPSTGMTPLMPQPWAGSSSPGEEVGGKLRQSLSLSICNHWRIISRSQTPDPKHMANVKVSSFKQSLAYGHYPFLPTLRRETREKEESWGRIEREEKKETICPLQL